jgi:hypothetical protein
MLYIHTRLQYASIVQKEKHIFQSAIAGSIFMRLSSILGQNVRKTSIG